MVTQSPLNLSLLLISLALLISLSVTPDWISSLPKVAGMVLGLGAFFVVWHHSRQEKGWWVALVFFLILGSGVAMLGALSTTWVTAKFQLLAPLLAKLPSILLRLPGAPNGFQPNEVAGSILWVLPVMGCLAVALLGKGQTRKAWALPLLAGALFSLAVLALTQSRSAWLALAIAGTLAIFLVLPRKARLALLVIFLLVVVAAGYGITSGQLGRLVSTTMPNAQAVNPAYLLSDIQLRQVIWQGAIMGLRDFPLTGMGMNIFRSELGRLYPWYGMTRTGDYAHAHNEFLQAGLDLGLPGLLAFTSLYLIAFWLLWRSYKQSSLNKQQSAISNQQSTIQKALILGLGTGLLAHLLFGMTDAVALGAKPGILFWLLLGLIAGLYQTEKRKGINYPSSGNRPA